VAAVYALDSSPLSKDHNSLLVERRIYLPKALRERERVTWIRSKAGIFETAAGIPLSIAARRWPAGTFAAHTIPDTIEA
jgi:hypothetical protein